MPFKVPADFFDAKPILVPSNATVEVLFVYESAYSPEAVKGKTEEQVVESEFRQTDALVVFDETTHYRIDFPMKGIGGLKPQP